MSVTINIYYNGKNGSARKFAEEMIESKTVEAIRNEDGNERYDYYIPMEDPETILLIDSWRDQKALDLHHSSSLMTKIIQLREKYDLHMTVKRYISDNNMPSSDNNFIRK